MPLWVAGEEEVVNGSLTDIALMEAVLLFASEHQAAAPTEAEVSALRF